MGCNDQLNKISSKSCVSLRIHREISAFFSDTKVELAPPIAARLYYVYITQFNSIKRIQVIPSVFFSYNRIEYENKMN